MTYATDQLKQNLNQVLQESENRFYETQARLQALEARVLTLEMFTSRVKPYLKTMELIDPEPTE